MKNPVTVQEKLDRAKALFDQAKAILTNPEASAEDKAKIEPLMEEAKGLKAEAGKLRDIMAHADEILEQSGAERVTEPAEKPKQEFKEWSEFLYAAWLANHKNVRVRKDDPRLRYFQDEPKDGHEEKTMVESVGASGGFLVPAEFDATLRAVMGETGIVRSRATRIRMRRRQIGIPVLDQTGTTAGVPHWFGGMIFYWAEEAAEKTETDAKFRQVNLAAHKLIGYTNASDELADDSAISLADFLSGPLGFAGGVSWMEDFAFLRGSGAGQPLGVINAGATIVVPRQVDHAVGFVDLANIVENFLPSGQGLWVYSQSMLSELIQMNGPSGNPSYIWQPSAREGVPDTLFGMPAVRSEKVPLLGVQGDIGLYDFRYYLLGDRQATTIESTQYDQWRYDKTSWRVVHRVDGQPWLSAPLTYQDGSTQISPFVILGEKSS